MRLSSRAALLASALVGCNSAGGAPQFSIRDIATHANETEYATSVSYEATILAQGDSAATRGPYMVVLEVKKLSGGNPESVEKATDYGYIFVIDGIGKGVIGSDYRPKKQTYEEAAAWPPPKYSVRILGFSSVKPLASTPVTN